MPTSEHASAVSAPPCATTPDVDQWFKQEVHAHDGQLKSYLRGKYPSVRDVDDVVQESYLRIWRRQLASPIVSAKAFLFQIAKRLALDTIRHGKVSGDSTLRDFDLSGVLDETPDPAQLLSYKEKVSLVAHALTTLPERCRTILILRKFKGVPQKEIAAQLNISERTVESQVTRGMHLLEDELRSKGLDGFLQDENR